MKNIIEQLIEQALMVLKQSGVIEQNISISAKVERTKDTTHGDFATNVAA